MKQSIKLTLDEFEDITKILMMESQGKTNIDTKKSFIKLKRLDNGDLQSQYYIDGDIDIENMILMG